MNRTAMLADRLRQVNANFDDDISALEARRHEIVARYLDAIAVSAAMSFWISERRGRTRREFLLVILERLEAEIRLDERISFDEFPEAFQFAFKALRRHIDRLGKVAFGGASS